MASGQQTIGEVSGGIAVFDVVGKKNTTGAEDLQYLAVTVRARAGSPNIDLNHTVVMMSDETEKVLLTYAGDEDDTHYEDGTASGDLFATDTWNTLTHAQFGVIVLEDGDDSCQQMSPVINSGDKVVLTIQCGATGCFAGELAERTNVYGQIIPEIGSPGIISFTTPASYTDTVFDLQ
jgi:flagellin FlaB